MTKPLRMGMAGLGVASTQILPAVSKLPYIKIAAAADLRREALAKFHKEYDAEVFTGFEEMCKSPNVDFVYVATPNELHARHVIAAADTHCGLDLLAVGGRERPGHHGVSNTLQNGFGSASVSNASPAPIGQREGGAIMRDPLDLVLS